MTTQGASVPVDPVVKCLVLKAQRDEAMDQWATWETVAIALQGEVETLRQALLDLSSSTTTEHA